MTDSLPQLEPEEYRRYGRHLTLPQVGEEGQRRLKSSSALVVGSGGLGSPVALYLAAAGVGRITLCDFDVVDLSNLQRQVLFGTSDVGRDKVAAATDRLRDLNPHVIIEPMQGRVSSENVRALVRGADVVLDGSDNFTTRYLVSDACVLEGRPYIYGSIFRFDGQASVFHPPLGPCYRCLFPEPPPDALAPNCAQAGVLGVLPGLVGTIQASEALKVLLGVGRTLLGRLLLVDALDGSFREVKLRRDPECPACGETPTITDAVETVGAACMDSGGSGRGPEIEAPELARRLAEEPAPYLLDVRERWEFQAGALPGAVNIALGDVSLQTADLPRDRDIIVYCRVGPRGARAVEMLRAAGFERCWNLRDGLVTWRDQEDPEQVVA
jgi:molybdopterin/thiamine biosynthesis adenylyltransferase/rhodanese-related sulfurtransferase